MFSCLPIVIASGEGGVTDQGSGPVLFGFFLKAGERYFHDSLHVRTLRFILEGVVAGGHFTCTLLFFLVSVVFFFHLWG